MNSQKYLKHTRLKVEKEHIELGKKYSVPPIIIAYLRIAMINGKYSKDKLVDHILEENTFRRKYIADLEKTGELNEDQKQQIAALQEKTNIRQIALTVLENVSDEQLKEILHE